MFLVMLTPWLLVCLLLSAHWSANPQYSFGWLVPPLAAYLCWRRGMTRPAPAHAPRMAVVAFGVCVFVFGPLWLFVQPSPDWRLMNWVLAFCAGGALVSGFALKGGWRWAVHFAVPSLFILTAIPWPLAIEQPVVQGLMRVVAAASADLLTLGGIAAVPDGSTLLLKAGPLGVDEACSGVRSLQASLMASVFLGELYRFGFVRRVGLVAAACGIAFASNVGRTWFLAWRVAGEGMDAVAKYHDQAGFVVLGMCFVLLWGAAALLGRGCEELVAPEIEQGYNLVSRWCSVGFGAWLFTWVVGTEVWFRSGEAPRKPGWVFAFPDDRDAFQRVELSREGLRQLQADSARGGAWKTNEEMWLAYSFHWEPGPVRARILARAHQPANCLPSTGWEIVDRREPVELCAAGLGVPFSISTFEKGDDIAHVYFCAWQESRAEFRGEESVWVATWRSVAKRERNLAQQVVEVVLIGPRQGTAADAAFVREVSPLIRPAE